MKRFLCLLLIAMLPGIRALSQPVITSLDPIEEALPVFDPRERYETWNPSKSRVEATGSAAVTTRVPLPTPQPIQWLITRSRFPAEDGTVDAVVWFDPKRYPPEKHRLEVAVAIPGSKPVVEQSDPLTHGQYFLCAHFPQAAAGQSAEVSVKLIEREGRVVGEIRGSVEIAPALPRTERHEITLPIQAPPQLTGTPLRVGIPLPRGMLRFGSKQLTVLDPEGKSVVADVRETARWSRHGTTRWLEAEFLSTSAQEGAYRLVIAAGKPETVSSALPNLPKAGEWLSIAQTAELATRLAAGKTTSGASLVNEAWLRGGFVEHAKGANYGGWGHKTLISPGRRYEVPATAQWVVEETGQTGVTLRCEEWFADEATQERFCRFVARLRIYPESPFLDFEYTWIFTGDGNRDRIRNMGWRFPVDGFSPEGFPLGNDGTTVEGRYLLQHDSQHCEVIGAEEKPTVTEGGRAPGLAMGKLSDGRQVVMAVRDFWQNFPAELETSPEGLTFYLWPRHGKARQHPLTLENAYRLWFAHEGETLSFALPQEMTEGPIYVALSGVEPPFAHGTPESVNAQGIAKTTTLRFFVSETADTKRVARDFHHWNERESEPYCDPEAVAASGVFGTFSAYDPAANGALEEGYQRGAEWPHRILEALQVYGKWIYGDFPMVADPDGMKAGLYRAYNKAHWGWPYSWMPYARSGEGRYRKWAHAATRMMADTVYCHYVSPEVRDAFAALPERTQWAAYQPFRAKGWNNEGLIPWAGGYWGPTSRMYCDKADFLLKSRHLDGDRRSMEVLRDWMIQTKEETPEAFGRGPIVSDPNRQRWCDNLLAQYVYVYEETFDPWFIMAAHALAKMQLWNEEHRGVRGHFWQGGATAFLRYTRNPEYRDFYLRFAREWLDPLKDNMWVKLGAAVQPGVEAFEITGDPWFLRRVLSYPEMLAATARTLPEPPAYEGWLTMGGTNEAALFYGWYLKWAPALFAARRQAEEPDLSVIPSPFMINAQRMGTKEEARWTFPEIALELRNAKGDLHLHLQGIKQGPVHAEVSDDSGKSLAVVALAEGDNTLALPHPRPGARYRLRITADPGQKPSISLRLPIAEEGVAEVYRMGEEGAFPGIRGNTVFWLRAERDGLKQEAVETAWKPDARFPVRRASLWNATGTLLEDVQGLSREIPKEGTTERLPLGKWKKGDFYRLTFPGVHHAVRLPEGTARWYAVSRSKWFDPDTQVRDRGRVNPPAKDR